MSYVMPAAGEFWVAAARGRLEGVKAVHKFGLATNIQTGNTPVDVWDGVHGNLTTQINPYNWLDAPVDIQVSSSSALDVGNEITGEGLDENWMLATGSVLLTGQTPVLAGLQRRRIFRGYTSGPTETVGIVFVSEAGTAVVGGVPTDPTKIYAIIHPGSQQTQMGLYTVPEDHELLITHGWGNIAKDGGVAVNAACTIKRRDFGGVFRTLHSFSLGTNGNTGDHRPYSIPLLLKAKTDLVYRVEDVSANGASIAAGFHGILIKK